MYRNDLEPPITGQTKQNHVQRLLRQRAADGERGAVLFLMVILLLIFMVLIGLAVDVSAKASRAQELQNGADAAALAGAQIWGADALRSAADDVAAKTAAEQAVADVLSQNGIGPEVSYTVAFPDDTSVTVDLVDNTFEGLLAPFTGGLSEVERSAEATYFGCSQGCAQTVAAPPTFRSVEADGTGDGFTPIKVGGNRFYAINHHQNGVACIDTTIVGPDINCWSHTQPAFNNASLRTSNVHHPTLIGDKIYYTGVAANAFNAFNARGLPLVLTCFDTSTDSICPNSVSITGQGRGVMAVIGNEIFLFTGAAQVHCFLAESLSPCSGYAGGRDTQASALPGFARNWDVNKTTLGRSDRQIIGTKVYYSIDHNRTNYIQCWDTAGGGSPCTDFTIVDVGGSQRDWIKQVLNRNAAGVPTDFCILGRTTRGVKCWSLTDANRSPGAEARLAPLYSAVTSAPHGWDSAWSGLSHWHADTNSVYVVNSQWSVTTCFSFNTGSTCGQRIENTALGLAKVYGWITDSPNCLIGLGDASIFVSATPDLAGPCNSSGGDATVTPCTCLGAPVWPELAVVSADAVTEFNIRVLTPSGAVHTDWTDLLVSDVVLSGPHPFLTVQFEVLVDTGQPNPWVEGNPPTFELIGLERAPHLTG